MKKFATILFLFSALSLCSLILLIAQGCCKEKCNDISNPACENYDPCSGKRQTSANFVIEEYLCDWEGDEIWIESDTFSGNRMDSKIRFRALNDADSFIWEIGASKYYTKSLILNSFPENRHDKITLIAVNKHTNKNCFPADNGRDTSIHKIFTWPSESYYDVNLKKDIFNKPTPIKGIYKGYYTSKPNLEVIIGFYDSNLYCPSVDPNILSNGYLINIPQGYGKFDNCEYSINSTFGHTPFGCVIAGNQTLVNSNYLNEQIRVRGLALMGKDRKSIQIQMSWFNLMKPEIKGSDKFNGIKIK